MNGPVGCFNPDCMACAVERRRYSVLLSRPIHSNPEASATEHTNVRQRFYAVSTVVQYVR